jgi:hypothetical protein
MTFVREHYRQDHSVIGHYKNMPWGRIWYGPHPRSGSLVKAHYRIA